MVDIKLGEAELQLMLPAEPKRSGLELRRPMVVEDLEADVRGLVLLLADAAGIVKPLDGCLDHEHVLRDTGWILASGLEDSTSLLGAGELIQAAVSDGENQRAVAQLRNLDVQDSASLGQLDDALELLEHFDPAFLHNEGGMVDATSLRTEHDFEDFLVARIMVDVNRGDRLRSSASQELTELIVANRIVDGENLILAPRRTKDLQVLQEQAVGALKVNTNLLDLVRVEEMAVNVFRLE